MIALKLVSLSILGLGPIAASGASEPNRIGAIFFDKSQVQKLYLYPGRSTLVDFPCPVTRAASGPAGDVKVTIGTTDPSELDVWLRSGTSQPTNLTVRCGREVFVFDVIPSKTTHQEYIEIVGAYGSPVLQDSSPFQSSSAENFEHLNIIESSDNRSSLKRSVTPHLIQSSSQLKQVIK